MRREIIKTSDGSSTIRLIDWDEQYHSKHGAIAEAEHVFIEAGLDYKLNNFRDLVSLSILEIGFGTGLNSLITYLHTKNKSLSIRYVGIEAYPISKIEISELNYSDVLKIDRDLFQKFHDSDWSTDNKISDEFILRKEQKFIQDIDYDRSFDIIYFDAFGPRVQPELWTERIFLKMYKALKLNGVLVTYSAKGSVRRAIINAGFKVEKLPGPPGKREMLRAFRGE